MKIEGLNNVLPVSSPRQSIDADNPFSRILEKSIEEKSTNEDEKLKTACREFEAIFLNQVLQQMRAAIPTGSLFGEDYGEKVFLSLLDQQYANEMSKAGGIGLAEMLYNQFKMYEANKNIK